MPLPPSSGVHNVASREPVDKSRFVELYRDNLGYVFTTARRLGVTPAEVDDVVQETFLTAHRRLDCWEGREGERSWLFSILYHVVLNHRRSHRRRTSLTEYGVDVEIVASSSVSSPDKEAETRERVQLLEAILDTLDPERRAILVLSELEEKPIAEIAAILEMNVNTATSRLRLARGAVEAALARHRARDGWRYK